MPSVTLRDDASLLTGTNADFGLFYLRHEQAVVVFFYRRTRRADLAADLAAETFARVIEARRSFDPTVGEPRAWLFGVARNVLLRSFERGRVDDRTRRTLGMQPVVLTDPELARIENLADDVAIPAMAELPSDQAEAVALRVIDELSYDELASRLNCSKSVARKRVSRGLKRLRAELEPRS